MYDANKSPDDMDEQPIEGIHCNVANCAFHGKDNQCCADKIDVGPSAAHASEETECSTFQKK